MNNSPNLAPGIVEGIVVFYIFFILLALASAVFWIVEIIDVARREFPQPNTKTLWLLVVVLGHGIGALVYYFAGKPSGWLPGEPPRHSQYPPNYPSQPPPGQWPPPLGGGQ